MTPLVNVKRPASPAALLALAAIIEVVPCQTRAVPNENGDWTVGYGFLGVSDRAVSATDWILTERAQARLLQELVEIEYERARGLRLWHRLGPRRRAAVLSWLWRRSLAFTASEQAVLLQRGLARLERLDEADVPRLFLATPSDSLGRMTESLVAHCEREVALWNAENPMTIEFKATYPTVLKKAPIDSGYLAEKGKVAQPVGMTVRCESAEEIAGDAHIKVVLANGAGEWFLYGPHWQRLGDPVKPHVPGQSVNWSDMSASVGQYITVGEILRDDPRRAPVSGSQEEANLLVLAGEFDKLREAWGGPIIITSGYRPEPFNRQVGGVPNSRHVTGEALDICPSDGRLDEMFQWLRRRWSGGLGDGRPKGFIHIDMRNGGRFYRMPETQPAVTWDY